MRFLHSTGAAAASGVHHDASNCCCCCFLVCIIVLHHLQGINRIEVKALWALVAIECALLVFFLALSIALMWVPYMSACRQHRVSAEEQVCILMGIV
jgi:hypothetical protein